MKNLKMIRLAFCFMLSSVFANAQNEGSFDDLTWSGKWSAVCPPEMVDRVTIRNCELCPMTIEGSSAYTNDIEMIFAKDSLQIIQKGEASTVPIKRNKKNLSFGFTFHKRNYEFRVFLYDDLRILEEKDGLLLILCKTG